MCGFVAEYSSAGGFSRDIQDYIDIALPALRRRGPDDFGFTTKGRNFFALNTRLEIQDLTRAAALPLQSRDERSCLAYNGELYNAPDLRARCQERGWNFHTRGDSEVILATLRIFGPSVLNEFNGIFAFTYFDEKDGIVLARDHAGIKPLFYSMLPGGGILSGSDFETIVRLLGTENLTEDSTALGHYLRLGNIPAPSTMYLEIRALEPGTAVMVDRGGHITSQRFFTFGSGPRQTLSTEAVTEELGAVLAGAIRRQMIGDVEIGALISGGIDSPLVAALASDAVEHPFKVYSCAMAGAAAEMSEEEDAKRFARSLGLNPHFVCMDDEAANELLDEVILSIREPMADEGMFPALLVSERASRDVKVVFSGDGADELFMGYVHRQAPMRAAAQSDSAAQLEQRYGAEFNDFPATWFSKCFPNMPFDPNLQAMVGGSGPDLGVDDWMRRAEYQTYLPFILAKTDRASMNYGLEVRVPFLDLEVVRFAASIDPISLYKGDTGKVQLRQLLASRAGFDTPGKRPFTSPMDAWMRGSLRGQAELSISRLAGFGSFDTDPVALSNLLHAHLDGRAQLGMALWRIVVLDHWISRLTEALPPVKIMGARTQSNSNFALIQ